MKKVSLIIPCYNEEEVLPILYERLNKVSKLITDYETEFIFINDGSKDKTEEIVEKLYEQDKRVKLYSFSRNFGHQAAVSCGIHHTNSDLAVIIDADLQDPPEIIPDMIKMYEETKSPIIYGKRISREGETFFKKITATLFYRTINLLSEVQFPVDTGDFRLIDKKVIEAYKSFSESPKYIRGLISWMGFEQRPFEYHREARAAGGTKYTLKKMMKFAMTGIISFSTKPLKILGILGIISIFISLSGKTQTYHFAESSFPAAIVGVLRTDAPIHRNHGHIAHAELECARASKGRGRRWHQTRSGSLMRTVTWGGSTIPCAWHARHRSAGSRSSPSR